MGWRPLLVVVAVWAAMAASVGAQPTRSQPRFPDQTGRIVDQARLIGAEREAELETRLAALEKDTGTRLMVVTLDELSGLDIVDYGDQLARHWNLDQSRRNGRVLLIVAVAERRIRIEVSQDLETVLNDTLSAQIIQQQITPAFRVGGFERGLVQSVAAMEDQLRLAPDTARVRAGEAEPLRPGVPLTALLVVGGVFTFLMLALVGGLPRPGRRGRGRGNEAARTRLWTLPGAQTASGSNASGQDRIDGASAGW